MILRRNNSFSNNCRLCSNEGCYYRGLKCYGGGVSAHRSNLNFTGKCIFGGNSAFSGGGIYSGSHSKLNLSGNTECIYNSALYGGGVYLYSSSNIVFSGNTTFIGNSVQDGGGVYSNSNMNIGETPLSLIILLAEMVEESMQAFIVTLTSVGMPSLLVT